MVWPTVSRRSDMVVILCEERSMRDTLAVLFRRRFPTLVEGINWQTISFEGKADLEKNFSRKMKGWRHLDPHFIIMRDNDGGDCVALKARLTARAAEMGQPFHIRIVCQELESWFLGDLAAVEAAFPASKAGDFQGKVKYRNPEGLTNASDELARLTGVSGKVSKAVAIAPHLDLSLSQNRSHSFGVFLRTVDELFSR